MSVAKNEHGYPDYGFSVTLPGANFDETVAKVIEELKKQGFGVLTDIDVKATLKTKINVDHPPYRILGACNPKLAHQALQMEPDLGLLLPCNVVVRQDGTNIVVAFKDPESIFLQMRNPPPKELPEQVKASLLKVRDALGAGIGH
jgi:uncharacterized protein (DUF302 family)